METINCQNCKKDFTIEPDDFSFYEKMGVPAPTFCPECRLIRRLARRNERNFHSRVCEKCQKPVIAIFSEQSAVHVYCSPCWWSDTWEAIDYGIEPDFSRDVFSQIDELFHSVPQMNLNGLYQTKINSDYTHMASWQKDCYMVTYSDYCENVIYGSFVNHTKDSVDNLMGEKLELCYETINCSRCYQTFFSVDCESCTDVWFSKNCSGCTNCFGCVNLKNKSYHIFNESYTKEEYVEKLRELRPKTRDDIERQSERARLLWQEHPQKYMHGWRNIDSTGDYLNDTKNAKNCFVGFNMEDCRYCSFVTGKITDTYDFINFGEGSSCMYEILQGGDQCKNLRMSQFIITNCQDVDYSFYCIGCRDIFGCVGLKKRQYCIFNKQYTKEEYFIMREKLIQHMRTMPYIDKRGNVYAYGEFFPIETSAFAYNETSAQEFFPLTKKEALASGYFWLDREKRQHQPTVLSKDVPLTCDDISDSVFNEIIQCEHKGTCEDQCVSAFKIIPGEVQFYRRLGLPLPKLCPSCRHAKRIQYRNPLKLWRRSCMNKGCTNEFETSYAPDRPEIVYCESCYQNEVV